MANASRSSASFDYWDRKEGHARPDGASPGYPLSSWNFALYSRRATGVTLLALWSRRSRASDLSSALERGSKIGKDLALLAAGTASTGGDKYYAYRVEGRHAPEIGFCFDSEKILLDPFAPAVHFPQTMIGCGRAPGPNDGGRHLASFLTPCCPQ